MEANARQASDIQGRPMNHPLRDRRALVTGGSRGIGAAIVRRLARDGAHVALTYVSRADRAKETAEAARALGVKALAIEADNGDPKAMVAAVDWTAREVGGLDILVNNAGIAVMARDLGARGIAVNNIDGGFTA
jgi:3-oxoacyl-[acyl-carrier protein] reductase